MAAPVEFFTGWNGQGETIVIDEGDCVYFALFSVDLTGPLAHLFNESEGEEPPAKRARKETPRLFLFFYPLFKANVRLKPAQYPPLPFPIRGEVNIDILCGRAATAEKFTIYKTSLPSSFPEGTEIKGFRIRGPGETNLVVLERDLSDDVKRRLYDILMRDPLHPRICDSDTPDRPATLFPMLGRITIGHYTKLALLLFFASRCHFRDRPISPRRPDVYFDYHNYLTRLCLPPGVSVFANEKVTRFDQDEWGRLDSRWMDLYQFYYRMGDCLFDYHCCLATMVANEIGFPRPKINITTQAEIERYLISGNQGIGAFIQSKLIHLLHYQILPSEIILTLSRINFDALGNELSRPYVVEDPPRCPPDLLVKSSDGEEITIPGATVSRCQTLVNMLDDVDSTERGIFILPASLSAIKLLRGTDQRIVNKSGWRLNECIEHMTAAYKRVCPDERTRAKLVIETINLCSFLDYKLLDFHLKQFLLSGMVRLSEVSFLTMYTDNLPPLTREERMTVVRDNRMFFMCHNGL